ncbi:MAG: hypothetical protein M1820_009774 [Bogoriella megaspora]|nr:MAG: hypothetical protein M1820_009774 [Bogoriella megaspora]
MRFSTAIILAYAGYAVAQTSTSSAASGSSSSSSSCDAQTILDTCVSQYKPQLDACGGNDWDCLCQSATNLKTCYNNCPNDPTGSSVQQQVTQYCDAAKQFGSSASKSKSSATGSSSSSGSAPATTAATTTGGENAATTPTGSVSSSSSASPMSSAAADSLVVPAGGALAVALGIFGML